MTGRTIEGLLFDEARAFISNLDSLEIRNWSAWKDDWPDWRPVEDVEGLTEMIFRAMHVSPPPPPRSDENSLHESVSKVGKDAGSEIILDHNFFPPKDDHVTGSHAVTANEFIVRMQKRYNKRLTITITAEGYPSFITHTKDISVGGMNLEDKLPEWISGYFKVRIAKPNSKQQIELTCCLIEDLAVQDRHRIAILPLQSHDDEKNLETWLAA